MSTSLATPFEVFFDLVPTGAVLYAPIRNATGDVVDFCFVRLNPAAQRLFGLPAQPVQTFREQYPHSVPTGLFAQYCAAYSTDQASTYDVPYAGDGRDTFFRLVAQRSGDLLVVSFTEMADLPHLAGEAALREAQAAERAARAEVEAQRQRLSEVLRQLPAQVAAYHGPDHIYTFVNQRYQDYFPARELLGRPGRQAVPAAAEQGFFDLLDRVYQTGEPYHGVELPVNLDFSAAGRGQQVFINTLYHPLRNSRGEIEGVLDFSYDVTEQVRARQQLEQLNQVLEARVQARTAQLSQQSQRLERLFRQVPAAMCMLAGPELVYEAVNPVYQLLFPDRQLLGQPLLAALPELTDHAAYHTIRHVFETGESNWQHELHTLLARADGVLEDRYWNYVQQPRYDEQGGIDGVLIFGYEVTEQVEDRQRASALNAELRAANQQLTRTNVDLDNFIYTASHDLKVPIANIEGLLTLLRKHLPADVAQAPNVAAILTRMVTSVERFTRTIGHLTEVAKLREEHSPATAAISLAAVVADVRLDLAPLLQAANAQLTVGVADFPPVLCSEKNLRSIVYNLLSNAVKYQHPDRRPYIDVRAHVSRGYTVLEVHDNGLGLGPAHLPKLFGMFQRFHPHLEGSGIGLYMVKRMVENAGGSMEVHSQLGAGTTFFVRLPHVLPTP